MRDADITVTVEIDGDEAEPEMETYSLQQNAEGTEVQLNSQRLDYCLRNESIKLGIFRFASEYFKVKQPPNKKIPKSALLFQKSHPQYKTHMLQKFKSTATFSVTMIFGPQFHS